MKEHLSEEKSFEPVNAFGERSVIPSEQPAPRPIFSRIMTFIALLCLWVILSGRFDLFHLSLGVISCALVSIFSGDLLFPESRTGGLFRQTVQVINYVPWLLYQVILANLHVLYLVFHPRMMDLIDPQIIRFDSKLKKEISLVTFANSITLTPGTITMYVSVKGAFQVHAIDKASGDPLPGEMERRIAKAFEDE
ncbi:MAG: Na+/H+ antiporter subunit E [Deltaproteobacteria bacterium]|nr:Na+/H+ antiporter subunit E [Deltaproteobacteria bacterium]